MSSSSGTGPYRLDDARYRPDRQNATGSGCHQQLSAELLARQAADGSWRNDATEMREDEPVIATSFAVAALALCRNALGGERQAHAAWR